MSIYNPLVPSSSSMSVIYTETPSGLIDGSNLTYTTVYPIQSIITFAINGQYIFSSEYGFSGSTITMVDPIPAQLSGTSFTVVYQSYGLYTETPSGLIDGSNTTYTTAHTINMVFDFSINGEYIHPSEYTAIGNNITFITPLPAQLSGTVFTIIYS